MKRIGILIVVLGLFLFAQVAQADWTSAKRLTWTTSDDESPAIAVDSLGNIHAVWHGGALSLKIYYRKSTDWGTTWPTIKILTPTSSDARNPAIAADSSGYLHVVWQAYTPANYEIYYMKSTDAGATWTESKRMTWNSGNSCSPYIAVDSSDNLYLVWMDDTPGNSEIYYGRSTDGGATWTAGKKITWNSGDSWDPAIAVDLSGYLHLVWYDWTPGTPEVYYKNSTDGGASWSIATMLTLSLGYARYPDIVVDSSGYLHVVWDYNSPATYEIYYRKSTNGGTTWSTLKRLTWNLGNSYMPEIAVDSSDKLHVVWYDWTPGYPEIYYKNSTDGGSTWSTKRITWNSGNSENPAIAVDSSDNLHVIWKDHTAGNYEIYYKKYIK